MSFLLSTLLDILLILLCFMGALWVIDIIERFIKGK